MINQKIRLIRDKKKMTLTEVSEKTGLTVSKLSKIESGEQKLIVTDAQKIAEALSVKPADFLSENNDEIEEEKDTGLLTKKFIEAVSEYQKIESTKFAGSKIGKIITKDVPKAIIQEAKINLKKYKVDGSIGKGQFAEVFWIAVFRREITISATKGIYIVYLFDSNMNKVYLSLNQGFTFFKDKYGTKEGKIRIKKAAEFIRRMCKTIPEELNLDKINLKAVGVLGKGYEQGHITGKCYDLNNMPNDEVLIDDLRNMIAIYEEVYGNIKDKSLVELYNYIMAKYEGFILSDDELIEEIEKKSKEDKLNNKIEYEAKPKSKREAIKDMGGNYKYPRESKVARNALAIADYKCEIDTTHFTFKRRTDENDYTEPHHLIPLSEYGRFDYSLDVEENIISLCSTCHNCLHYGTDEERIKLLKVLYDRRIDMLRKVGLDISFEELKKYYGIK